MNPFPTSACLASVLCLFSSCSTSVDLDPADRASVSPMTVSSHVKPPEWIYFKDQSGDYNRLGASMTYGTTGVATVPGGRSWVQQNQAAIDAGIGINSGKAGSTMRSQLIRAFERKQVARITPANGASYLEIEMPALGLGNLGTFQDGMQFYMEVRVRLKKRDGKVIWETYYASYPHNENLPVRSLEEYRKSPELLRKDYELTCRYIAELLADDLKDQTTWQP